jgi:hypothetical protein
MQRCGGSFSGCTGWTGWARLGRAGESHSFAEGPHWSSVLRPSFPRHSVSMPVHRAPQRMHRVTQRQPPIPNPQYPFSTLHSPSSPLPSHPLRVSSARLCVDVPRDTRHATTDLQTQMPDDRILSRKTGCGRILVLYWTWGALAADLFPRTAGNRSSAFSPGGGPHAAFSFPFSRVRWVTWSVSRAGAASAGWPGVGKLGPYRHYGE